MDCFSASTNTTGCEDWFIEVPSEPNIPERPHQVFIIEKNVSVPEVAESTEDPLSTKEEMVLIKEEEEDYIKMENKMVVPITFPDVGSCTTLECVKEVVSNMSQEKEMDVLNLETAGNNDGIKQDMVSITFPKLEGVVFESELKECCSSPSQQIHKFLEDPLKAEVVGLPLKPEPELKLHADDSLDSNLEDPLRIDPGFNIKQDPDVDGSKYNVLASITCIENSTRVIQNSGTSCGNTFGETVVQGLVPDELEILAQESTCLPKFDTHTQGLEVKEEKEESLLVGRLKCSWRENEFHEFICDFCLHSFSSKYILIMHVFTHMDDLRLPKHICRSCGETFSSEIGLNRHLKMNDGDLAPYSAHNNKNDCIYQHENIIWECDKVSVIQQSENQSPSQPNSKALRAAGKKSHKCPVCDKSFTQLRYLKSHSLTHTGVKPHKCTVCPKSFTRLDHLKTHSLTHTGMKPHKCTVCDKSFTHLGSLKIHSLIHTGIKPHKCDVCNKSFTALSNLKSHSLSHTGVKPHKCKVCDKSFSDLSHLKTHSLTHTGVRPHKCTICDKSFTQLGHLKRHSVTHTGMKPYKCTVCDKSFTQLGNLKTHSLTHTGMKPHKCTVCDKSFTHLGSLKIHSLIHSGIKPHKCDVCNKSFTALSNLKSHSLSHTGIKPHKCNVCDKSFTALSDLKKHSLIHTGVKPHKCSVCGKCFTELGALKRHSVTHTGMKPYKCTVCDKSFTQLGHLKIHSFTHTEMKPHKCTVCDKSFTQLGSLKTHSLIHTGVKPHKCNVCDKSFTVLSNLKKHSLIHTRV